jgi:lipid A disaccharide synthetase
LIRYRGPIALSNLVAGKKAGDSLLASEWIGPYATPENLAAELLKILNEPTHIEFLSKEFKRVREILSATDHRSPSENAADEILKWVGRK